MTLLLHFSTTLREETWTNECRQLLSLHMRPTIGSQWWHTDQRKKHWCTEVKRGWRFLEDFTNLIRSLSLAGTRKTRKPVQTGILLSTGAALAIQKDWWWTMPLYFCHIWATMRFLRNRFQQISSTTQCQCQVTLHRHCEACRQHNSCDQTLMVATLLQRGNACWHQG